MLSWHWSVMTTSNEKSENSQLGKTFAQFDFSMGNKTRHQQPHLLFLAIVNLEVVPRKFLGVSDLPKTQALFIHKLAKIDIISEDKNLKFSAF